MGNDNCKSYYFKFGIIVISSGLILALIIGFWWLPDLLGCGVMGVLMMISLFVGGYLLSDEHKVAEGEIRRSIAIPVLAVFFWLLAFGDDIIIEKTSPILQVVLEKYWLITLIVLGFYFGGRSFEKIIEKIPGFRYKELEKRIKDLET